MNLPTDAGELNTTTPDIDSDVERWIHPRYKIRKQLGEGTMGKVYLAFDNTLGRSVAIKVNRAPKNLERMEREARLLAQVNSGNVTAVYDFGRLGAKACCVVMQWIDGRDLGMLIDTSGAQPPTIVHDWMKNVCEGMMAAENANIVHRDLKPSNILINGDNLAIVTDFGLANSNSCADLTISNTIVGTPHYIAPEQVEDSHAVDSRADIYSFGATFYHAATGTTAFEGANLFDLLLKHKIEPLVPPNVRNPSIPPMLNDCIERCMAKKPADRFNSFAELANILKSPSPAEPWMQHDEMLKPYWKQYEQWRPTLLSGRAPDRTSPFQVHGRDNKRILLYFGNITDEKVDAIVSSDDSSLSMGGGVSAAIRKAAGSALEAETARFIPARRGRAVVTSAGNLPIRFIFHGITIGCHDGSLERLTRDIVAEIVDACFYHAETYSIRSIAFPLLGTGVGGLSREIALDAIFNTVVKRLLFSASPLNEVRIVLRPLVSVT